MLPMKFRFACRTRRASLVMTVGERKLFATGYKRPFLRSSAFRFRAHSSAVMLLACDSSFGLNDRAAGDALAIGLAGAGALVVTGSFSVPAESVSFANFASIAVSLRAARAGPSLAISAASSRFVARWYRICPPTSESSIKADIAALSHALPLLAAAAK